MNKNANKGILIDVFNEMPDVFSSNQFAFTAKSKGYPAHLVSNGNVAQFLHKNAVQTVKGRRTWIKNKANKPTTEQTVPEKRPDIPISVKIEQAINFLKSEGYKIMKPVTDFIEV